jgi:ABC-type transport system involved in multi-copper enzyme maturation permease subunit
MYIPLLIKDELLHLKRIRVIAYTLILMPILAIAVHALGQPARFAILQACMLASLGAGGVLTASLVSDIEGGTVMLIVIRSIPRWEILLSRIAAIMIIVIISVILSIITIVALDTLIGVRLHDQIVLQSLGLLAIGTAQILICAILGVVLGTVSSSPAVAAGAFLVLGINVQALVVLLAEFLPKWVGFSSYTADLLIPLAVLPLAAFGLFIAHHALSRKAM